ncbi:MAG: FtsX-like permease family protein, partial [Polyangiaceae bacterium]
MTVQELRAEIEARPSDASVTRRFERVRRDVIYDEIAASCAIAGAHLSPLAIRRLLERGSTVAGSLADHLLVLGYARAALEIARARPAHEPERRLVTVPEIERLHVTITSPLDVQRTHPASPGAWRRTNLPPIREGMVSTLYVPLAQITGPDFWAQLTPTVSVAAVGTPSAELALDLAEAFGRVDSHLTLGAITLDERIHGMRTDERNVAILSGCFGGLALLLAVVGLYGVTGSAVHRRRAELGVRVALGARPRDLVRLVVG